MTFYILEPFFAIRKLVYFSWHDSKSLRKHAHRHTLSLDVFVLWGWVWTFGKGSLQWGASQPSNWFGAQLHWLCPLSSTAINAWRLYGDLGQDLPCKAQVFFRKFWPQNWNPLDCWHENLHISSSWRSAFCCIHLILCQFDFCPPLRKNSFVNSDSILTLAMGCYSQRIGVLVFVFFGSVRLRSTLNLTEDQFKALLTLGTKKKSR